jgi:hypothetical protein
MTKMKNRFPRNILFIVLVLAGSGLALNRVINRSEPGSKPVSLALGRGSPINSTEELGVIRRAPAETAPKISQVGGYFQIGFDKLSGFTATVVYEMVNSNTPAFYYAPKMTSEIPQAIKDMDGKDVAVKGFMLPLVQEAGRVKEFILLKNQMMCCFGRPPQLNEWIRVTMAGDGLKPSMDRVVTIYGKLHVSTYRESSARLGLYRMDGEGMTAAQQM